MSITDEREADWSFRERLATFWRELGTVTAGEQARLMAARIDTTYADYREDDPERDEVLRGAQMVLEAIRVEAPASSGEIGITPTDDPRWGLIQDLSREIVERNGRSSIYEVRPIVEISSDFDRQSSRRWPLQSHTVSFTFDYRMSLGSVIEVIRHEWPELMRRGALRRTRPLRERKIALVRFVCVEHVDDLNTWRERVSVWNATVQNKEWMYRDKDGNDSEWAMSTDFGKAWGSLFGSEEDTDRWRDWFTDRRLRTYMELRYHPDAGDVGGRPEQEGGETE